LVAADQRIGFYARLLLALAVMHQYIKMNPKVRNILQIILFIILIGLTVALGFKTYHQPNGANLIAAISLFVAILSLAITTITLNQNYDAKLPQIIVDADFSSRYGLLILKISNYGEKTAFDIIITWNKSLENHKGENISTLGDTENQMKIAVLQKGQTIKIAIDEISAFFKKYSDDQLNYDGHIKFKLGKSSIFKLSQDFFLNLIPFRKTLYHDDEKIKAFFELQKIPDKLEQIKSEIKKYHT
jgi:hypothetical protein